MLIRDAAGAIIPMVAHRAGVPSTMLAASLQTRAVHFAFLFGPPRTIERQEAALVYDRVCEALKIEDFVFKYESPQTTPPRSRGFAIHLERKEGRGVFAVTVDNENLQKPMRILLRHAWPASLEDVKERFDFAADAVFDALPGEWQRVFAEARLRAHCSVPSQDAGAVLRKDYLKLPQEWIDSLGKPLTFIGLRFKTAAGPPGEDPLEAPSVDLSVELLREDRSRLYVELVSIWPQAPSVGSVRPGLVVGNLRSFDSKPSQYVEAAYGFLSQRLRELDAFGRPE